jgi:hypothetical protein
MARQLLSAILYPWFMNEETRIAVNRRDLLKNGAMATGVLTLGRGVVAPDTGTDRNLISFGERGEGKPGVGNEFVLYDRADRVEFPANCDDSDSATMNFTLVSVDRNWDFFYDEGIVPPKTARHLDLSDGNPSTKIKYVVVSTHECEYRREDIPTYRNAQFKPVDETQCSRDDLSRAKYEHDFEELSEETTGQVQAIFNRQPFPNGAGPADVLTREEIAEGKYGLDLDESDLPTFLNREQMIEVQNTYDEHLGQNIWAPRPCPP